jgi:hypothetical protein
VIQSASVRPADGLVRGRPGEEYRVVGVRVFIGEPGEPGREGDRDRVIPVERDGGAGRIFAVDGLPAEHGLLREALETADEQRYGGPRSLMSSAISLSRSRARWTRGPVPAPTNRR